MATAVAEAAVVATAGEGSRGGFRWRLWRPWRRRWQRREPHCCHASTLSDAGNEARCGIGKGRCCAFGPSRDRDEQQIPCRPWAGLLRLLVIAPLGAHVDVVHAVRVAAGLRHGRSANRGLRHRVHRHGPAELVLLEIGKAVVGNAVADHDVHTRGLQNARNFLGHLLNVGSAALPAEEAVHGALVQHRVKRLVGEVKVAHVHLLPDQGGLVLVALNHLINDHAGDVDVRDGAEAVLEHVLRHARVATARHEDGILALDVLTDDIAQSRVPLVPVEQLGVLGVAVRPVARAPVLRHGCVLESSLRRRGGSRGLQVSVSDVARAARTSALRVEAGVTGLSRRHRRRRRRRLRISSLAS
mmetsp:Transcript_16396/g.55715  ORF Transcript_16396/g.55715 Transcript_16396/m.55715 type:complete len:357 (+) Transcript_16396:43-1113(+)